MRTAIIKAISVFFMLFVVWILVISCDQNAYPEYLIECASDNGFVPSYRAYFAIKDDSIAKISKAEYEHYIYEDKENFYQLIPQKFYSFEVNAKTENPAAWEYEPDYSGDGVYNTDILIQQLQIMGIYFKGQVNIEITKFDDYVLIGVINMDKDNIVIDSQYAAFHGDEKLSMKKDLDLNSVRNIYKHCKK